MTAREAVRNRTACVLALVLPLLFNGLTLLMTSERIVVFQLASISLEPDVEVPARSEVLVFMALIAIGFMSAFFGVNLIQKHGRTNRRLVFCGYRPSELVLSKLIVLSGSVLIVSLYCFALMTPFFVPRHPASVFAGLALVGYVYGCYGLLMGTVWRRELESIFSVILLTNIDVGWLQYPVFYTEAENKTLIHCRYSAYRPVQAAMTGAFTDHGFGAAALGALAYGHDPSVHCYLRVLASGPHGGTSCAAHQAIDGGDAMNTRRPAAAAMLIASMSWCAQVVAQKPFSVAPRETRSRRG